MSDLWSVPLDAVVAQLSKEFGKGVVQLASEMPELDVRFIPFGIFPLDLALGGGLPAGRVSLVWGRKSAGKTTALLKLVHVYQQLCGRCLLAVVECVCPSGPVNPVVFWSDVEGTYDPAWARTCGVDQARVLMGTSASAEEAIDVLLTVARANEIGLCVVDSVAQLAPTKEVETSMADWQQGLGARLVNKMIRKLSDAIIRARNEGRTLTAVLVNQTRTKIAPYAVADTMPYGLGQLYAASVVLKLKRGVAEFEKPAKGKRLPGVAPLPKEYQPRPMSVTTEFIVEASKVGPPRIEGEYRMRLRPSDEGLQIGDIDDLDALMLQGSRLGYVRKDGKQWRAGPLTAATLSELRQRVRRDSVAWDCIRRGVVQAYCGRGVSDGEEGASDAE